MNKGELLGKLFADIIDPVGSELREQKAKVRAKSKENRKAVVERSGGECECCQFFCPPILHVHHVVGVGDGGDSEMDNLVALCPNCHEACHRMFRRSKGELRYQEHVYLWAGGMYGKETATLLQYLGIGLAVLSDQGAWTPMPKEVRERFSLLSRTEPSILKAKRMAIWEQSEVGI